MFSITAINDTESRSRLEPLAPTKEAQEASLTKSYQDGLASLQAGELTKAQSLFQSIVHDPISIRAQRDSTVNNDAMLHLRFLAYKNLAETYVKQGSEFHKDALQCYTQAVKIDEKDVVLWNRLGTLACSLGLLNIARRSFEHGLHCSPRHWSCMEKLVEVLVAIGDQKACLTVVKRLLKMCPSHPRALYIQGVIEENSMSDIALDGIDKLEPQHSNLSFSRKRKPDASFPKAVKKRQHSIQLSLAEPSWLVLGKAILDGFQNRQQGKVLETEELKDRGSYLANSRVSFVRQGSQWGVDEDQPVRTADKETCLKVEASGCDQTDDQASRSEKLLKGETDAHERRSTRLERLRSRKVDKCDDMVAECSKSLRQSLEPFIQNKSYLQVEEQETGGVQKVRRADCHHFESCLMFTSLSTGCKSVSFCDDEVCCAKDVIKFLKDFSANSGLYHIGQEVLERVSCSVPKYHSELHYLLELESYTRQWGSKRSSRCSLFLAELYADAATTSSEASRVSQYLKECNYNICRVIESVALEIAAGTDAGGDREPAMPKTNSRWFWVRFHWLNGRYCMMSGDLKKGFNEFRSCLALFQEQVNHNIILPHCKADNIISLKTLEQKLYEFEMGDLLKNSAAKMSERGQHSELIEVLSSALFSAKGRQQNTWATYKCNEVTQSHEFLALNMLISACQNVKPLNTLMELRCHMRKLELLCYCAGLLFTKVEDDQQLSPSHVEGDEDRGKEMRVWNKAIAEEVKLTSRCAAAIEETVDSISVELGRTQDILLTLLVHFGSGHSKKFSHLSLQDQLESSYFVDAAVTFCRLQQLYPSVPLEKQVSLVVTVHELLAEKGICSAGISCEGGEGSFLKMAIKHFLGLEAVLKERFNGLEQTNGENVGDSKKAPSKSDSSTDLPSLESKERESELERKRSELGIDSALDQCFYCLYGLNLQADLEPGKPECLAVHKTTNCGDFQTKEQCAAVLQYVMPFATKAFSRAGLPNLRKVLLAVRQQFPQPPAHVLAGNSIDYFLDDLDFDEARFSEMVLSKECPDELISFALSKRTQDMDIFFDERRDSGVPVPVPAEEPFSEVYKNLYHLLTQVEDNTMVDKSASSFILTKEGEEHIEENARLFKYDLLYNINRFESWQKLASLYDDEVDLLLNDGSKSVNVLEWRKTSRYTSRVENSRRRSRRCLLMSLGLAKTKEQQFSAHELLALVYYDTLQNAVPSYDQQQLVQKRDTLWVSRCLNSVKHFEAALLLRPEWTHLFYLGKLSEKLGKPHEEAFSYYKRAVDMNPSAVDPLYRLHRSRLKVLCKTRYDDAQVIQAVAKYCFVGTSEENVNKLLSKSHRQVDINLQPDESEEEARVADIAAAWNFLFTDCKLAMQTCVDGELKHFHKARYCLAHGLYCRGEKDDMERAKDELGFCFRSSRSLFTINMWELDGVMKKNRRKPAGGIYAKKTLELGIPESSRKFITCVRKYLLLYIDLCEKAGDVVTLERAYSTLRTDKRFNICLEDIAHVALTAYVRSLGTAIGNAETFGYVGNTTLQGFLERMFQLFMDHGMSWPDTTDNAQDGSDFADKAIYCYIHRYLHYLESDCRVDALEHVNERMRKRFKNLKQANEKFQQVCRHAILAWFRALCCALSSITPLDKIQEQPSQVIVDLQYEVLLSSQDAGDSSLCSASSAYLVPIKAVPIVQVAAENAEKAHSLLRAAFVFYREATSGPFPDGINLYLISSAASTSGSAATKAPTAENIPVISGYDYFDVSTPRKLLLWAYALIHGRAASIPDVVRYCEEQAKARLKKMPPAQPQQQQHQQAASTSADKPVCCTVREHMSGDAMETSTVPVQIIS